MAELTPDFDISTAAGQMKWRRKSAKVARNWEIFEARTIYGLTYGEIAKRYSMARPRGYQIVKRIKKGLRDAAEAQE